MSRGLQNRILRELVKHSINQAGVVGPDISPMNLVFELASLSWGELLTACRDYWPDGTKDATAKASFSRSLHRLFDRGLIGALSVAWVYTERPGGKQIPVEEVWGPVQPTRGNGQRFVRIALTGEGWGEAIDDPVYALQAQTVSLTTKRTFQGIMKAGFVCDLAEDDPERYGDLKEHMDITNDVNGSYWQAVQRANTARALET